MYYCTSGCQADGNNAANWHRQMIETTTSLDTDEPIAVATGYLTSRWEYVGHYPRLAFASSGDLRLVYGNHHFQGKFDSNNHIQLDTDLVVARLKLLAKP